MSTTTVADARPVTHGVSRLHLHVTPTTRPEEVVRKWAREHRLPCETVPRDWFFPESNDRDMFEKLEATRRLCFGCPVQAACLQWALDDRIMTGMYGGASATERERMTATRRQRPGRAPRRRRTAA